MRRQVATAAETISVTLAVFSLVSNRRCASPSLSTTIPPSPSAPCIWKATRIAYNCCRNRQYVRRIVRSCGSDDDVLDLSSDTLAMSI
jgi:hypothetical protein